MSEKAMQIGVLTMVYNEEQLLPFFLKHYDYVDEIRVLLETDSDDRSEQILTLNPKVRIKKIHIAGGIVDEIKSQMINAELRDMSGQFDWIYVLDPDEFIYPDQHHDPREFLAAQQGDIVYAHMWQVYRHWADKDLDPEQYPLGQRQHGDPDLYSEVESQFKDKNSNSIKPSVIRGGVDIELLPGNHKTSRQVRVCDEIFRGVHWQMAEPKIAIPRRMARKFRISNHNRKLRHGFQHFDVSEEIIQKACNDHNSDPKLPIFNIPNLSFLRYLSLEINDKCPLTEMHPQCPRNHDRFAGLPDYGRITTEEMISWVNLCIDYGFTGLITLHNYNEPMATREIAEMIVNEFPDQVSLWTSGLLLDPIKDEILIYSCHDVMITRYPGVEIPDFSMFPNVKFQEYPLDNRAKKIDLLSNWVTPRECHRKNWEIVLNNKGFVNMCCGDWAGEIHIGNIKTEDPHVLLHRWNAQREAIADRKFPPACLKCFARGTTIPMAGG